MTITTPADGSTYTQGQTVNATYTCVDSTNGPGLKPGTGGSPAPSRGAAINTATTGTQAFSVTATSTDGQTTSDHGALHRHHGSKGRHQRSNPLPQVAIPGLSGVGLLHVSANVTTNNTPLAGKTVAFTTGKTKLCTAQTNTKGVAACQIGALQEVVVLLNNSYTATFSGDNNYTASSASTPAVSVHLVHGQARTIRGHAAHHQTALGARVTRTATTPNSYAPASSRSSTTNTTNPRTQRDPPGRTPATRGIPLTNEHARNHPTHTSGNKN